jgi:hypothetical protein
VRRLARHTPNPAQTAIPRIGVAGESLAGHRPLRLSALMCDYAVWAGQHL